MLIFKGAGSWLWPLLLLAGRWQILAWAVALAASVALVTLPWARHGHLGHLHWLATPSY